MQIHAVHGFNSMIVRLKECPLQKQQRAFLEFQFYDSPIKSPEDCLNTTFFKQCFNSMIVRLKERKPLRPYTKD